MMGYGVTGLLISAAAGYWVLTQAEKEKNRIKKLGQYLGLAMIVVSVLGAACKIYYQVINCPPGKMGSFLCPFTGKAAPPAQK